MCVLNKFYLVVVFVAGCHCLLKLLFYKNLHMYVKYINDRLKLIVLLKKILKKYFKFIACLNK